MDLHKKNKLMILFLSPENPLWGRIRVLHGNSRPGASKKDIQHMVGISPQALPNWCAGQPVSDQKADSIFERTFSAISDSRQSTAQQRGELCQIIERFREAYDDPNARVYDVAHRLSMDTSQCQKILDTVIYDRWPLFPAMYYDREGKSAQAAHNDLQELAGVYYAWMRRDDFWLQCPLRVRYLLTLAQGSVIRCKMNVPILNPRPRDLYPSNRTNLPCPRWEYDGFLAPRHSRMFWTFEKRQEVRNDYVYFVTCAGKWVKGPDGSRGGEYAVDRTGRIQLWVGSYLTVDQDDSQSVVRGDLLLQRTILHPQDHNDDRARQFMWSSGRVLRGPETLAVQALWDHYHVP